MSSRMLAEAREAPQAVARALARDDDAVAALVAALRGRGCRAAVTIARGSSDHAAHFAGYLLMSRVGVLVSSLPMSLLTLQDAPLDGRHLAVLAFSQSGQSPDVAGSVRVLRERGACTAAWVNQPGSPLAAAAEWAFDLHAGPETSVAATKSFIAQLVAGARLGACWAAAADRAGASSGAAASPAPASADNPSTASTPPDAPTLQALHSLPPALQRAVDSDWSAALPVLAGAERALVVGRGLGLSVALEAALKLKEVCGIQAEAFSGAELLHGPMALVERGYPVLLFAPRGPAQAGLLQVAAQLRDLGARVLLAAPPGVPGATLPLPTAAHEDLDPICAAAAFYPMVEALARERGLDPDRPRHLRKVTRTE